MGRASREKRERRDKDQSLGNRQLPIQQSATLRQGPIPDAEELQRYENIQPGFAERIMALAENEASARQTMMKSAQQAEIDDMRAERSERRIGQFLAFLVVLACLILAGYAAHIDRPWVAGFVVALSIGSVCTAFIYGKRQQEPQGR